MPGRIKLKELASGPSLMRIRKRKYHISAVIIGIVVLLICTNIMFHPKEDRERPEFLIGTGISSEEGLKAVEACSTSWANDSILISAFSYDRASLETNIIVGDGKTGLWYFTFFSLDKETLQLISCSHLNWTKLENSVETSRSLIGITGPIINSTLAAKIAYDHGGWRYLKNIPIVSYELKSNQGYPFWKIIYYDAWDSEYCWTIVDASNGSFISSGRGNSGM
jgi:hypothetical protein